MSSVGVIRVGMCVYLEPNSVIVLRVRVLSLSTGRLSLGMVLGDARKAVRRRCTVENVTSTIDEC